MEAALRSLVQSSLAQDQTMIPPSTPSSNDDDDDDDDVSEALARLAHVLERAVPWLTNANFGVTDGTILLNRSTGKLPFPSRDDPVSTSVATTTTTNNNNNTTTSTVSWLWELCRRIDGPLDTLSIARSFWEASHLPTETEQQAALFDVVGESGWEILLEIMPRLTTLQQSVTLADLEAYHQRHVGGRTTTHGAPTDTLIDVEQERREYLRQEAIDAAHAAALAKAQWDTLREAHGTMVTTGGGGGAAAANNAVAKGMTHTVISRQSEKEALKLVQTTSRRAAKTLQLAREAGAILNEEDFSLRVVEGGDPPVGPGGLRNRSRDELDALQLSLLPEGTRQYYDERGLPVGTEYIKEGDVEKIIVPPPERDTTKLHPRLKIRDIMDEELAQAFQGTTSLNPMQSTVFEAAFKTRDNMLICAPTGAGKTNVAMLATTAHFRDVGLIGSMDRRMDIGKKVIYIAPMKALAQEVVEKFSSKLKALRLIVRELTGDMQLTRAEAETADVIEKWDVVTRKSVTDERSLGNQCGLLIIDEVHLLADERGAVIESVVSRLHRLVESRQRQVRIVALSATLPNYQDVATFLQVPERGVFFFGPEHRPVPLRQTFIGVTNKRVDRATREKKMNEVCFDVVLDSLRQGYQVMVFVHSRKGTGDTARELAEMAAQESVLEKYFRVVGSEDSASDAYKRYAAKVSKSRNREVAGHFENGIGIHHAGMLRGDRKLTEQMFSDGAIKVLCCTATLAWGINLPAHTVVIKGTEVYSPEKGGNIDLSILDVQQIFGRAGRPQFDTSGDAYLITTLESLPKYMDKLVRPVPIESNFLKQITDHLNAEIVGRTVTNVKEGATWLMYTYLYVRMLNNPLAYGISMDEKEDNPRLQERCLELIMRASKELDANKMISYHIESGNLSVLETGRVAAHFYIETESIAIYHELFKRLTPELDADLLRMICSSNEFRNLKVRQEEIDEIQELASKYCPMKIRGAGQDEEGRTLVTDSRDKAFVLLQAYISRAKIKSFTLISDMNYIMGSAARLARGLFEISLTRQESINVAVKLLRIAKSIEKQIWWFQTPLRNFENELNEEIYKAVEEKATHRFDPFEFLLSLLDMQVKEVGQICHPVKNGATIHRFISLIPRLSISCNLQPITRSVLRVDLTLNAEFSWMKRWHGGAQNFWLFVEDPETDRIYHREFITLSFRTYREPVAVEVLIPTFELIPEKYIIRVSSDGFVGAETILPVYALDLKFPPDQSVQTRLLDLTPMPVSALQDSHLVEMYRKFEFFNPIQTQLFHILFHTDSPIFLGAPTGSGKTVVAELAMLRMKKAFPQGICVYIAPLKALARERLKEWQRRLGQPPLNWKVLELSGDTHHDQNALERADILVCTPEKYDLVSRGWRGPAESLLARDYSSERNFLKRVRLLVIDEVHLLGEERGAVLEAIVSRTRFISRYLAVRRSDSYSQTEHTRIIGLSTALANPIDLADWMGIETKGSSRLRMRGLYNFKPEIRPVPIEVIVQGYPGRAYCPRMATMNKPCFAAIKELSPKKPVLIFVASRRQTRLTAFDIISYAASEEKTKQFLWCDESYVESVAEKISDEALRHTITFGIGLHHAGLPSQDRELVEDMFLRGEIQVLVATATLAWGVNLPAHLVIVKGAEYFDAKSSRYIDYPITDVLQMVGRAGRPGFDTSARAIVMVRNDVKDFYKKFLHNPFPVESCLKSRLPEVLMAEIAAGTIVSLDEAVGYMSWTFYARRVKASPSYYGISSESDEALELGLVDVVKESLTSLQVHGCIKNRDHVDAEVTPTALGVAASSFYLDHRTPKQMQLGIREARKMIMGNLELREIRYELMSFTQSRKLDELSAAWILYVICSTHELDELPVRHNEEILNKELSDQLMWGPDPMGLLSGSKKEAYHMPEIFEDPHTKAFLLVQAHLEKARLPISDYVNDTKSVMDNIPRLFAAVQFIASHESDGAGSFELLTQLSRIKQCLQTRSLFNDDPLFQLLGVVNSSRSVYEVRRMTRQEAHEYIKSRTNSKNQKSIKEIIKTLFLLPLISSFEVSVRCDVEKTTGRIIGKMKIGLTIVRDGCGSGNSDQGDNPQTLVVLAGTYEQRLLLAKFQVSIPWHDKWSFVREVEFDWSVANANGGEGRGVTIVRAIFEDVRGLDVEQLVCLKQ